MSPATLQRPQIDPRTRPYEPRGGALRLMRCRDRQVLMDGPAGTGKTLAILTKIDAALRRWPGARGLVVRKTRASMSQSVLVTYEEKVLPEGDPLKDGPSREHRTSYVYPNGSELVVGGMDKADRIMSTEYDIIGVVEATELTEDDWEKLTTRLRNAVMPFQQLISDCNPAGPQHWLNQRCLKGQTTRVLSRHEDNPTVTEDYLDTLRALTGARRARLYEGKWVAQEGLVYPEWGDANLIDEMPAGWQAWRKLRSIDFGFTNPFVCLWGAVDGDGRLYIYREWYRTQIIVSDHAARIKELSGDERYEATAADHDAEDRATLHRAGVLTVPARKAISPGIQAVEERIRPAGDGRPRLFLLRTALVEADPLLIEAKKPYSTEQEFGEYIWPKGQDGKPMKEVPVDDNNHGCLIAGTLVATEHGSVPIEEIRAGDKVWTRAGIRRVSESGLTNFSAPILKLQTASGEVLEGTGNHPVYVEGSGFVRLDAIRYNDVVVVSHVSTEQGICQSAWLKRSSTAGSSTVDTQMRDSLATATISGARTKGRRVGGVSCIGIYGRTSTDRFRTDATFTTKITIRRITRQKTLSALHGRNTARGTERNSASEEGGTMRPTALGCAKARSLGTARRRAGRATRVPQRQRIGRVCLYGKRLATIAIGRSEQWPVAPRTGFAAMPARLHGATGRGWTTRNGIAPAAARSLPSTSTALPETAHARVLSVADTGKSARVYNLKVDGEPEFFANGILVHNCDALRYMVMQLDGPRIRTPPPNVGRTHSTRRP